jgi:hypothetical protein
LAATNKFGVAPAAQRMVLVADQTISTVAFARVLNSSVVEQRRRHLHGCPACLQRAHVGGQADRIDRAAEDRRIQARDDPRVRIILQVVRCLPGAPDPSYSWVWFSRPASNPNAMKPLPCHPPFRDPSRTPPGRGSMISSTLFGISNSLPPCLPREGRASFAPIKANAPAPNEAKHSSSSPSS